MHHFIASIQSNSKIVCSKVSRQQKRNRRRAELKSPWSARGTGQCKRDADECSLIRVIRVIRGQCSVTTRKKRKRIDIYTYFRIRRKKKMHFSSEKGGVFGVFPGKQAQKRYKRVKLWVSDSLQCSLFLLFRSLAQCSPGRNSRSSQEVRHLGWVWVFVFLKLLIDFWFFFSQCRRQSPQFFHARPFPSWKPSMPIRTCRNLKNTRKSIRSWWTFRMRLMTVFHHRLDSRNFQKAFRLRWKASIAINRWISSRDRRL